MPLGFIRKTLRYFNRQFLKLNWLALIFVLTAHCALSLLLIWLAGEQELLNHWFYFYITTATTVGYGDLSPVTIMGRWVASLWIMPGAVVLFAGFLGKLSSLFITIWRKRMQGRGDYSDLDGHIVILGWHGQRTARMIQLIYGDTRRINRKVVLCTTTEMDNPFPEQVLFVRGENYNDENMLHRAGLETADRIIVDRSNDDQTLTSCLTLSAMDVQGHIVAWFDETCQAQLLKKHCPEIECHTNISVELLVRSAQDPGSFRLQGQLLSTLEGPTQYCVQVPEEFSEATFGQLLKHFKVKHEAIALGIADSITGNDLRLNPASHEPVKAGQLIYFMAAERIRSDEIEWSELASA